MSVDSVKSKFRNSFFVSACLSVGTSRFRGQEAPGLWPFAKMTKNLPKNVPNRLVRAALAGYRTGGPEAHTARFVQASDDSLEKSTSQNWLRYQYKLMSRTTFASRRRELLPSEYFGV